MRTSILILVFGTVFSFAYAQRVFNLNDTQISSSLLRHIQMTEENSAYGPAEMARVFHLNPDLKSLTNENVGDKVVLDFFYPDEYLGTIETVTHFRDGSMGITLKIDELEFGYCIIVITKHGVSIKAKLAERDRFYLAAKRGENTYLSRYKYSAIEDNSLPCANCNSSSCTVVHTPRFPNLEDQNNLLRAVGIGSETLPGALSAFPNSGLDDAITISVLVPYTKKAKDYAAQNYTSIENAIVAAFQTANFVSANSGLNIFFDMVFSYETNYVEKNTMNDLYNLQGIDEGYMDEVHDLRKKHKADIVMLIPSVSFTGGVSYLLSSEYGYPSMAFGLSRVEQFASSYTMVHEFGHILGASHHKLQGDAGLYSYSYGWRDYFDDKTTRFATVMTYENLNDGQGSFPRIPYFSDPNVIVNGVPIGASDANNVLTMKRTKLLVSLYSDAINTSLTDIIVSEGVLSPPFNPDITDYTLFIDDEIASVSVTGTTNYEGAILSGSVVNMLVSSENDIVVLTVKSHDKTVMRNYTIHLVNSCTSYESTPQLSGSISSPIGSENLNLNLTPAQLINKHNDLKIFNLAQAGKKVYMRYSASSDACYAFPDVYNLYPGATFKFKVTETGSYTFQKSSGTESIIMTIFNSETASCESFVSSNCYWSGTGTNFYYNYNSMTAVLTAGTEYFLQTLSVSKPTKNYWSIEISNQAGGQVYQEIDVPAGIEYTYIALCKDEQVVKHHHQTADFRFLGLGAYKIHGVSYSTANNPEYFIGQSLDVISECVTPSAATMDLIVTAADATINIPISNLSNMLLYPNPVKDHLFIESEMTIEKVDIYNQLGRLVFSSNNASKAINLSNLPSGVYIVRIYTNEKYTVHKIEKE